jgi:hypothetical protein
MALVLTQLGSHASAWLLQWDCSLAVPIQPYFPLLTTKHSAVTKLISSLSLTPAVLIFSFMLLLLSLA